MTCLLVSKEHYPLKEARVIAKDYNVPGKCRTLLIGIDLYFCFGTVPDETTIYDINLTGIKIFFLSS
jgi:hypothetical protein